MKKLILAVCEAVRPPFCADTTANQVPLGRVLTLAGRATGCQPALSAEAGATTRITSTSALE